MKTEDDDGVVCEGFEIPGYGGPRAGRVATWEQRETMSVHKIWSINCLRGTRHFLTLNWPDLVLASWVTNWWKSWNLETIG